MNQQPARILIVSPDPARQAELEQILTEAGPLRIFLADTANAISRLFASESIELVVVYASAEEPDLLESAAACICDSEQVIPLVAAIQPGDTEAATAAAASGVDGLVYQTNTRQLQRLLLRQIDQLYSGRDAQSAERHLADIENRYTLLLESSSEAIAYIHEGLHILANPSYLAMFGAESFDQLEGMSMLDLLEKDVDGPDVKKILKLLQQDELPDEPIRLQARRLDGSNFKANVSFSRARYGGESCAQMLIREAHEGVDPDVAAELDRLKKSDLLTGLLNQSAFLEKVDHELAERGQAKDISMMLMSIDDFDRVQTQVGISATDELIRKAGQMIIEAAGAPLAVARLRDQIFAALVETPDPAAAEQLARQVVEHCSGQILEIGSMVLQVTVSVGIAQGGSGECNADILVGHAGIALNEGLRSGGNAYVRYRPRVSDHVSDDDAAWRERLLHALDHDEVRLMVSPIIRMDDDSATIYEIETRVRSEGSDEVLLPSVFLNAAARVGLAPRMDRDLLDRLTQTVAEHDPQADDAWLVTLSASSVELPDFCDHLQELLTGQGLDPQRMIWAFRELEVNNKLRMIQDFMKRFKALGCRFALIDVGPESSVEPSLKMLDLAYLRLAPEMVQNMAESEDQRRILADIAQEALRHEVLTIAPRVEHTSDLATLWQLGITLVQGEFIRERALP